MALKFIYFDLGKVLLNFDVEQMLLQMGQAAGLEPEQVREVVFRGGLQLKYEAGLIDSQQFYAEFCRATGSKAPCDRLAQAGSDIFELNYSILPLVARLGEAGYRLGILSNTCENHWEHCTKRFRILTKGFSVHALSYRLRACKPEAAIFRAAAEMAGCAPEEVFFTDDTIGHVAGARAFGFDAVPYTSTPSLVSELRTRGIRFNY